jgi:hypothetical protein
MLSCDIPDLWRESFSLSAINLMLAVKIELVNSEVFPPFLTLEDFVKDWSLFF